MTKTRTLALPARVMWAAGAAFVTTLAWRFLTFSGFTNDHYAHLGLAQQLLLGDLPIRDFSDPGWPLTYLLSAGAWRLFGSAMVVEWSLTAVAFAIAAACTLIAAYWLSRSLPIAACVTALEILIYPRTYGYPKLLPYAIAAVLLAAVAVKPSRARLIALGVLAAAAFLLRHDHGLYTAAAVAVCLAVASWRDGIRPLATRLATVAAAAIVTLLPWVVFVALNGGLMSYFDSALEFARREANASNLRVLPHFTLSSVTDLSAAIQNRDNATALLFWVFWSVPAACAALLITGTARNGNVSSAERAVVWSLVAIAVCTNAGFLRDVLRTRLSDAIVAPAILGAWLLGLCWMTRWRRTAVQRCAQAFTVCVMVLTTAAITEVAEARERLERTGATDGIGAVAARFTDVAELLSGPHRQIVSPPSHLAATLMPFFDYVDRCTAPSDRILVTGETPDVVVLAGRRFASDGVVMGAWYSSAVHQARTVERFTGNDPLLIVYADPKTFRRRFPIVEGYVAANYSPMLTLNANGDEAISVLFDRRRQAAAMDQPTGWPCFR